jgi:hypothetical protein
MDAGGKIVKQMRCREFAIRLALYGTIIMLFLAIVGSGIWKIYRKIHDK